VARLTSAVAADGAVADVASVTELLDRYAGNHLAATLEAAARLPEAARALGDVVNLGRGGDVTVVTVVPYAPPDADPATRLVRRIRDTIVPGVVGEAGVEVLVGGFGAQVVDLSDESQEKLPLVGGLVVALSFVLLAVVFRSLALPLKALLMNGLSIGAAYGLLVVVFQRDPGEGILHFTPTGFTQVYLPLLTFAVVFGLSMDYEIFLLGRIKEEWGRTGANEIAVARGLQQTARVITSAAAIMVAVFAAFTFTRLPEVQQLGFSLAAAVLVDATLVRVVLVPAAMRLLGGWNWWFPAWLDRVVPRVDLAEGDAGEPAAVPPVGGAAST
jgi:putative drug exporter of the RND superfamily